MEGLPLAIRPMVNTGLCGQLKLGSTLRLYQHPSLTGPDKHVCLPATGLSELCPYARYCTGHSVTKMKRYRNVSKFHAEKGMQMSNYDQGDDGSSRGMHKGGPGEGAPGKMSTEGGTVVESGRGQAGQAGRECSRLREM